jgi:UDP-glucuronate decarboxylase
MNNLSTALVFGGAGFIGSFLCERLLKEGKRVICVDNFSTGSLQNIDPLLRHENFQFLNCSVNEPIILTDHHELDAWQLEHRGIQECYHLATPTSIREFEQHVMDTLLTHSLGTYHVLEVAKAYGSRVLIASSSVVYGARTEEKIVFKETDLGLVNHLAPRASYDEGKRFQETMAETYRTAQQLDIRIARIFRTYGPRMPIRDGHQIPDFILAALANEPVHVNGGGAFKTSLVYVDDVVDGLIRLMRKGAPIGPVNIGSDEDIALHDVAERIIEMTASGSQIVEKEQFDFLTEIVLPDITKAKEELGWVPLVRLEEGLQKTVDYVRANAILLSGPGKVDE